MGRLQRDHFGAIAPVSKFIHVLVRHGLTMGLIAALLNYSNGDPSIISVTLTPLLEHPARYAMACFGALLFAGIFLQRKGYPINTTQALWVGYLFYISIVEELAFRLLLPVLLNVSIGWTAAAVVSNAIFAGLHYFTLRWKWQNCVFAFLGGMGLFRLLENSNDLMLIILVHFVATFLNTPTQPGAVQICQKKI